MVVLDMSRLTFLIVGILFTGAARSNPKLREDITLPHHSDNIPDTLVDKPFTVHTTKPLDLTSGDQHDTENFLELEEAISQRLGKAKISCDDLGGECMPKKQAKKCDGTINKKASCDIKKYYCCIEACPAITSCPTAMCPTCPDVITVPIPPYPAIKLHNGSILFPNHLSPSGKPLWFKTIIDGDQVSCTEANATCQRLGKDMFLAEPSSALAVPLRFILNKYFGPSRGPGNVYWMGARGDPPLGYYWQIRDKKVDPSLWVPGYPHKPEGQRDWCVALAARDIDVQTWPNKVYWDNPGSVNWYPICQQF